MKQLAALLFGLMLMASVSAAAMKPFKPDSLEQIETSHRGKPFLLLVWSMDCAFCQTSLEVLAKARAANPAFTLVTVTTDPLADPNLSEQVERRLASLLLLGDTWSFGDQSPERLRFALDPGWRGEKPRSYWYDPSGKRTAYSGLIKPERLEQWLRANGTRGK